MYNESESKDESIKQLQDEERHFCVYILCCRDNTFYTGYSDDPKRRLKVHNAGKGAKYTKSRLPVEMVYCEENLSKSEAMKRERAIKKLSRKEKERLIADKFKAGGNNAEIDYNRR